MGIAKYFEDIQKLRDNWRHLAPERQDNKAIFKDPVGAHARLEKLLSRLTIRTSKAVDDLEVILDLATDPEIKSSIMIEELKVENQGLQSKLADFQTMISALQDRCLSQEANSNLMDQELRSLRSTLADRDARLTNFAARWDTLEKENGELRAKVRHLSSAGVQGKTFDSAMAAEGVRSKNKK